MTESAKTEEEDLRRGQKANAEPVVGFLLDLVAAGITPEQVMAAIEMGA